VKNASQFFHLDDGFLDINEICYGTDQAINNYEKKHNVDLLNFWCQGCAKNAIDEIEGEI
jgi:uncharacterized protein YuzB (UPF0349 family)